jgi:hypothetical protein
MKTDADLSSRAQGNRVWRDFSARRPGERRIGADLHLAPVLPTAMLN